MTEKAIQNIYDRLLKWEGKNASQPYPIHKKMDATAFGCNDIYEWVSKTYTFDKNTEVLDAGCGVGYGSIYLSKHHNCMVNGISLSAAEVQKASLFAKNQNIDARVGFSQLSFDDLKPNSFDFIMAIESVKHTLDIDKTLGSLKNALKPNGTMLIVDDFLVDEQFASLTKQYAKDWALKVVLKHDVFIPAFTLKKDLTPFVKTKTSFVLKLGILLLSILKPILKVASIIRGGLYLEQLFTRNAMKYYVLEFKRQ